MLERMRGAVALAAAIVVAGAVAAVPGCRNGRPGGEPPPSPVAAAASAAASPTVILHGRDARTIVVHVELASTEPERARGLMYRNHLEPDAGMLFLFPEPAPLAFWMKNTLIPLDMLFLDHDRRVVGIVENAAPETETARRVGGQSQYVLEVGGGLSRQWGIEPGSTVEFRGLPAIVPTP
jgi:uncharacterized membrane protein (UPF0127 family)